MKCVLKLPITNRIFIKFVIKLRKCKKFKVTCNCIKVQSHKTENYSCYKFKNFQTQVSKQKVNKNNLTLYVSEDDVYEPKLTSSRL